MKFDINGKNFKSIFYTLGISIIILILVIVYIRITSPTREEKVKEEYDAYFEITTIEDNDIDYIENSNSFVVSSDRELSDLEKENIKQGIIKELGEDKSIFEVNGDISVVFVGAAVVPKREVVKFKTPSTPYETLNPGKTYNSDEVILE